MSQRVRHEAARVARFLLLGAVNSLTSLALYALLQRLMPIPAAYTLAYLAGIAVSAALSGPMVFRVRSSRTTRIRAFLGYATVFATGLALVWLLQDGLGWPALLAAAGSLVVTAPANYLVGRRLFLR